MMPVAPLDLKQPLDFQMRGGSIDRCVATNPTGFGEGAAYWAFNGASVTFIGVDIIDSYSDTAYACKHEGDVTLRGCRLQRLGSSASRVTSGAIKVYSGTTLIEDSIIEGRTPGGPPSPPSYGCINVGFPSGTLILKNTSLVRCSPGGASADPYPARSTATQN